MLVSKLPPPAARPVKLAGGFTGGLAAGWHALRQVTSWLLTGVGAVLPFAAFVILAVYAGLRGRRWLARRRAGPRPAD
jgi:membrane protein implicated in regulation of membrane protease activity